MTKNKKIFTTEYFEIIHIKKKIILMVIYQELSVIKNQILKPQDETQEVPSYEGIGDKIMIIMKTVIFNFKLQFFITDIIFLCFKTEKYILPYIAYLKNIDIVK